MKWFLGLWAGPLVLLATWYGLSYNDMHFGFFMLTRETHDLVFEVYGAMLGIPPEDIPPLVARALVLDTGIVLAILAFRRRRQIAAWWQARRQAEAPRVREESLSSAP